MIKTLDLRKLGKMRKCQILVERSPLQSPLQKLNFTISSQKVLKNRYQSFLVLSNFIGDCYFLPNILSKMI